MCERQGERRGNRGIWRRISGARTRKNCAKMRAISVISHEKCPLRGKGRPPSGADGEKADQERKTGGEAGKTGRATGAKAGQEGERPMVGRCPRRAHGGASCPRRAAGVWLAVVTRSCPVISHFVDVAPPSGRGADVPVPRTTERAPSRQLLAPPSGQFSASPYPARRLSAPSPGGGGGAGRQVPCKMTGLGVRDYGKNGGFCGEIRAREHGETGENASNFRNLARKMPPPAEGDALRAGRGAKPGAKARPKGRDEGEKKEAGAGTTGRKPPSGRAAVATARQPCAWTAVRATVATMSSAEHPRERSLHGFASPCSTAKAVAWPSRSVIL